MVINTPAMTILMLTKLMDKPWALAALSRLDGTAERGSDCCGDSDETEHAVCSHVKGKFAPPVSSPAEARYRDLH